MILLVYFALCVVASTKGLLENFAMPKYSTALSEAVIDVIVNFYSKEATSINILHEAEYQENDLKLDDILNEILYHVSDQIVQLEDYKTDKNSRTVKNPRKMYHNIIFCDSFEAFEKIFNKMDLDHFNFQGIYLIVLTKEIGNVYEDLAKIFETLWTKFVTNANILWQPAENEGDALMYTYYPFTSIYCEKAYPVMLNQYSNGRWLREVEYFPNKMKNLYRCPIRVATFNTAPFMFIRDKGNQFETDGIDGILLRVLSQKINFNVELVISKDQWGNIYENGTSTGAIAMVSRNQVNMTLGYFASTSMRRSKMSSSAVYYTSNLLWMVPLGEQITSLEKLLKPFETSVWTVFFLIMIGAFLFVAALKFTPKKFRDFVVGREIQDPKLNIVNITFGGSLHKLPVADFARFVLMTFMIFCFIFTNSYKGGLYNFMRKTVRKPEAKTVDEMVAKGFRFYMLESAKAYLTEMPLLQNLSSFISFPEYLRMLDNLIDPTLKTALLTSNDHLAYRNILGFPERYYHHAPEVLFANNLVIFLNLNSCLTFQLDQHIMYLVSAGLIRNWASKFIDLNFLKQKPSSETKALNLNQLSGAVQLLVCGLIFSIVIFVVEIFKLFFKKRKQRKVTFLH